MDFSKKEKKIIGFVIGIFLLFLLFIFQKDFKNFLYLIFSPFKEQFWELGNQTSSFFQGIFFASKLKEENQLLRVENQKLLFENTSLKDLKKENEILRKALDINLEKGFDLEIVKVIGKDISGDFLLINKGLENGVSENLPVITESKVVIGKVIEVYKNFSKVKLISAKDFSFDAKIAEREILGKARGEGNFKISLELLPLNENFQKEEIIITSAQGGIFPEGLLVGKIREIEKSPLDPFQRAKVSPFFQIKDLNYLFLIKKW